MIMWGSIAASFPWEASVTVRVINIKKILINDLGNKDWLIEFSSNSDSFLVRGWLICFQHLLYSVSLRCMLGGSAEVWTNELGILYKKFKGQRHFGMPRGAKMSLAFNGSKRLLFLQIQILPSSMHHKVERNYWYFMQNDQWESTGGPTSSQKFHLS